MLQAALRASILALIALAGCDRQAPEPASSPPPLPNAPAAQAPAAAPERCPERGASPQLMPGVTRAHLQADYWLSRQPADVDEVLLDAAGVRRHNAAFRAPRKDGPFAVYDLDAPLDAAGLRKELEERFAWLKGRFKSGKYVTVNKGTVRIEGMSLDDIGFEPQLHTLQADAQIYCAPSTAAYYTPSLDLRFNRNHCSMARKGEAIQTLARWPGGLLLARTRYSYGWITADTALAPLEAEVPPETKPITRRAVLEAAFAQLGAEYGWGGAHGGQDCSRFLMNVFERFGLELPRHSASQAQAGTFSFDVTAVPDPAQRLRLIDAAAERGVTLLHFPGHIMLYLGRDADGRPMAIHSFAEYLVPCEGGGETLLTVDRISVSDLELGRDTSRKAFIDRITKVVVIGKSPGTKLTGVAQLRPSAPSTGQTDCRNGGDAAIYYSPKVPTSSQTMRIMVTAGDNGGPGSLTLHGPGGQVLQPALKHMGGPPHGYVAQLKLPVGKWRADFGDGTSTTACRRFKVRKRRPKKDAEAETASEVWPARRKWSRHSEALYGLFVEALFDYPGDDDLTWKNLHTLLRDKEHNLLYDHFGEDEDNRLRLKPDCADLPYLLRAYFAWKMGLPYGYRQCSRGRAGRPPKCGDLRSNFMERSRPDDVDAFQHFANRKVRNGVHSASGRTHPDDSETDFYPVPISRNGIKPGTLYADPYGHLLVVAKWVPQGADTYGTLIAADAQPDGTIGRRRFWRGSFLFSPETKDVGAGFKAFRPIVYEDNAARALENDELKGGRNFPPFSRQQYKGSADDFYGAVEGLINPRPLDPEAMQISLVDALNEAVKRRVVSVNNGEAHMAKKRGTMKMPSGYSIFETIGPWEDFATPSRDLRLLISIDTVLNFPEVARRAPERFGIEPAQLDAAIAALEAKRDEALAARSIEYTKSDGAPHRLTLKDVTDRRKHFEMAYNPNDCVEIRWGAFKGSPDMATCRRHRPAKQDKKMRRYRPWFSDRRRPPR